jgi:hypothetical protein
MVWAACFFLSYNTLSQLSYFGGSSVFWVLACGLILAVILRLAWLMAVCAWRLQPRRLGSLFCTIPMVLFMQLFWPDPATLHFWLHKSDYLSKIAATQPSRDGRRSVILDSDTVMFPGLGYSAMCTTEIIYDNGNNLDLMAETDSGRASLEKLGDDFYLRFPPCG